MKGTLSREVCSTLRTSEHPMDQESKKSHLLSCVVVEFSIFFMNHAWVASKAEIQSKCPGSKRLVEEGGQRVWLLGILHFALILIWLFHRKWNALRRGSKDAWRFSEGYSLTYCRGSWNRKWRGFRFPLKDSGMSRERTTFGGEIVFLLPALPVWFLWYEQMVKTRSNILQFLTTGAKRFWYVYSVNKCLPLLVFFAQCRTF